MVWKYEAMQFYLLILTTLATSIGLVECVQITLSASNDYSPCSYVLKDFEMIDCKAAGISEIPQIQSSLEKPVREIRIEFMSIQSIPTNIFESIKETLESFYFSSTEIIEISPFAFQSLVKLKKLHISSDELLMSEAISLKQLLAPLNKLEEIHLSGLNIEDIESDFLTSSVIKQFHLQKTINSISFHTHSFRVGGASLKTLSLTQLNFKTPNSNFSLWLEHLVNINELKFENCGLTKIPEIPTTFKQLAVLNLNKNYIDDFTACSNLANVKESLKQLILSNNVKLKSTHLNCLNVLRNLEVLDLRYNFGLLTIPPVIQLFSKLKKFYLDNCGIKMVEAGNFIHSSVELISLSGNNLEYVDSRAFSSLNNLEMLFLNNVNMRSTVVDNEKAAWNKVFRNLSALRLLSMSDCDLTESIWVILLSLSSRNLQSLYLNKNKITSVLPYFFVSFQNVTELDLSNNKISTLKKNSFYGLPSNMRSLNLQNNQLTTLYKCDFNNFETFKTLEILNNPLVCDCRIKWLVENSTKAYSESLICEGPSLNPNNAKKMLTDIPLSELRCQDPSIKEPICQVIDGITPPIIPTVKPPPSGNFTVNVLPVYEPGLGSLFVHIKFSDIILRTFDSAQLQYKSNMKSRQNVNIPFKTESKLEIKSVSSSETFEITVLLIVDGVYYPYSYNTMTYRVPSDSTIKLSTQVIAGIVAGVLFLVLGIIVFILMIIFRNKRERMAHAKYKSDRSDAISATKIGGDSIYDYDYPEMDKTPREFVRASTRSTILTALSEDPITMPNSNGILKNQQVTFFPMHPQSTNNRQTQSTSNLPYHYNSSRQAPHPKTNRQQSFDPSNNDNFDAPLKSVSAGILNPEAMIRRELPALPDHSVYPYERVDYDSSYLGMNQPVVYWPEEGRSSPPPLPPPRHLEKQPNAKTSVTNLSRSDAKLESNAMFNNPRVTRRSMEDSQPNSLFSDAYYDGRNPELGAQGSERLSQTTLADVKDIGYF